MNNSPISNFNLQADDLILLAILYLLYIEGNDDMLLYIILFLLLLN